MAGRKQFHIYNDLWSHECTGINQQYFIPTHRNRTRDAVGRVGLGWCVERGSKYFIDNKSRAPPETMGVQEVDEWGGDEVSTYVCMYVCEGVSHGTTAADHYFPKEVQTNARPVAL